MENEIRNMVFLMKKDKTPNQKLSAPKSRHNKRSNGSICRRFQDDDFIVFCFAQDGSLDIVEEKTYRPVNTKGEETKSADDTNDRSFRVQEMENSRALSLSVESVDSNQSESSKASFSFPILQWEVMGSPIQMPKSQVREARKLKVPCIRFHCFRF